MTLDELPEDAEERRVAVAERSRPDDVQAAQQRREQRDDDRVRVEQRQGREHDARRPRARARPSRRWRPRCGAYAPRASACRSCRRCACSSPRSRRAAARPRQASAAFARPASARYATVTPASGSSAGASPPAAVGRSASSARAPVPAASRRASAQTFPSSSGPAATMTSAPDSRTSSVGGLGGERRVDRRRDADRLGGEQRGDQLAAVDRQDRHGVAPPHAEAGVHGREAVHVVGELGERPRRRPIPALGIGQAGDRRPLRPRLGGAHERVVRALRAGRGPRAGSARGPSRSSSPRVAARVEVLVIDPARTPRRTGR